MPKLVDYDKVLHTLLGQGLKSLYYNSGSFGYPDGVATHTVGWVCRPDPTIRPEVAALVRQVTPPDPHRLATLCARVWENEANSAIWVMPRSHWAYELDFGSAGWMPAALGQLEIASETLAPAPNGAAIEFKPEERTKFISFLTTLLDNLSGSSDFQLAWPGRPLICVVHHHQQLWWTTPDEPLYRAIDALSLAEPAGTAPPHGN